MANTRIKAIDFQRARAKRELELIIAATAKHTEDNGLVWSVGKLVKDCPSISVSVQDTIRGGTVTHPVPLWLSARNMQHEARMIERSVLAQRKTKKASSSSE